MKAFIAWLVMLVGVLLCMFVGGHVMFVGGAMMVVHMFQGSIAVTAPSLTQALALIFLGPPVVYIIFDICLIISLVIVGKDR